MKIHFYLLFIVLCGGSTLTAESSIKELLPELDDLLANKSFYVQEKEQRLNRLKIQLKQEVFPEKRYELCYRIVDEYKSYISDSALVYIEQNLKHAQKNKNNSWLIATQLQYSFVLSSSGLFIESETILKSISREKVPETFLVEYWKCFELLYTNVNIYQEEKRLVKNYPQMIRNYRDSILAALQHDSMKRHYYNYLIADSEHDFKKAEAFLKTYLATLSPGTHEHAKKNYNMALLCAKTNRKDLQVNYLIQSVESDIKDAIKENRALLDLAIWLYEHNDIERAFKYIHEALDDANFYNARFRYFEISTILPIITSTYQNMNTRQNSYLKITLTVISVLFIILLITMFFLYKQMLALKCTRKGLKEANDHLEKMNFKLNSLNHELSEVNLIKDEYLGHFLDLCSEYVANLQDYKRAIKKQNSGKKIS